MSGFLPGNVSRIASMYVPSASMGESLSWTSVPASAANSRGAAEPATNVPMPAASSRLCDHCSLPISGFDCFEIRPQHQSNIGMVCLTLVKNP
jgi:hypothetical protein